MRHSGILLHLTSLPSPGGIGTLGRAAYDFVDFLSASGMDIWQVLPISPTGFGDSPYQSVSAYAGNPLLIDLDQMQADGLMEKGEAMPAPARENGVDYATVVAAKTALLKKAFLYARPKVESELLRFREENFWAADYALFSAVKEYFGLISWMEWPDEKLRMRDEETLRRYEALLQNEIDYYIFIQWVFFKQWFALKKYANKKGVSIFGDMPIYTAEDSADVWTNPKVFQLDERHRPTRVAGVPPDYFSVDGQRWGNPLYDWAYLKSTGYEWWLKRLKVMGDIYDIVRVDHFIGFANYYAIDASEPTARRGVWEPGGGRDFFRAVKDRLPHLNVVAEDLGVVNQTVLDLMAFCGYPGMKILTFAFSGDPGNPNLPQNYPENCVVYTGTHDNSTVSGWIRGMPDHEKDFACKVLSCGREELGRAMARAAVLSRADTCILPMQDILGLDDSARMNIPSTIGGINWQWRMLPGDASEELAGRLLTLNILAGRTRTNQ